MLVSGKFGFDGNVEIAGAFIMILTGPGDGNLAEWGIDCFCFVFFVKITNYLRDCRLLYFWW